MNSSKKCYEINNCPFNTGEVPENAKCPPFDMKIGCWEYDWVSFYNEMSECKEKVEWCDSMINRCKQCKVYLEHKVEMDSILNKLES
jgi:hypothetical protein